MLINPEKSIRQILSKGNSAAATLMKHSERLKKLEQCVETQLSSELKKQVRIHSLSQGTLTLATATPNWAHHLRFQTTDLLSKLRRLPGLQGLIGIKIMVKPYTTQKTLADNLTASPASAETTNLQSNEQYLAEKHLKSALQLLNNHLKEEAATAPHYEN